MNRLKTNTSVSLEALSPALLQRCAKNTFEVQKDVGEKQAQAFIRQSYLKAFDARVHNFLPHVVADLSASRVERAFCYKGAHEGSLFLEHYLNARVEQQIQMQLGRKVQRQHIVEIGGLALRDYSDLKTSLLDIAQFCKQQGFQWIMCTATFFLDRSMRRAGVCPITLAPALESDLSGSSDNTDWGRYYRTKPRVLIGHVGSALRCLNQTSSSAMPRAI